MTEAVKPKPAKDMTNDELRKAWLYLDSYRLSGNWTARDDARWWEIDGEWHRRGCPY